MARRRRRCRTVATDAGHEIVTAHPGGEDLADAEDGLVAGGVPVPVVQLLQAVRVDDRHRKRGPILLAAREPLREGVTEDAAVREPGVSGSVDAADFAARCSRATRTAAATW
jgi:hypothetical protein